MDAATMAGASELENRYGREPGAATQPPLCAPRYNHQKPRQRFTKRTGDNIDPAHHIAVLWEPRPFSPTKPTAWESSTITGHRIYLPDRKRLSGWQSRRH